MFSLIVYFITKTFIFNPVCYITCFNCFLFLPINVLEAGFGENSHTARQTMGSLHSKAVIIDNARCVPFDIKFTRQGFENACRIARLALYSIYQFTICFTTQSSDYYANIYFLCQSNVIDDAI